MFVIITIWVMNFTPAAYSDSVISSEEGKIKTYLSDPSDSVRYGDWVTLGVKLVDEFKQPVKGRVVQFFLHYNNSWHFIGYSVTESAWNEGWAFIDYQAYLPPGDYPLKVVFEGDDTYERCERIGTLTVLKEVTELEVEDYLSGRYLSVETIVVKLTDDENNPIPNKTVYFEFFDGSSWKILGNDTTDSYGIARITVLLNMSPGRYDFRVRFEGDDFYERCEIYGKFDVWAGLIHPALALFLSFFLSFIVALGFWAFWENKISSSPLLFSLSFSLFFFCFSILFCLFGYSYIWKVVIGTGLFSLIIALLSLLGIKLGLLELKFPELNYAKRTLYVMIAFESTFTAGAGIYLYTQISGRALMLKSEAFLTHAFSLCLSLFIATMVFYQVYRGFMRPPFEFPKTIALLCAILVSALTAMATYGASTYLRVYETIFITFGIFPVLVLAILMGLMIYSILRNLRAPSEP